MENQQHLAIARGLWDAIADANVDTLRGLISEKCVWRMHGDSPLAGAFVGADEILAFMARVGELTDELRSELIDIFTSESGAVLHYSLNAVRGLQKLETEHFFVVHIEAGASPKPSSHRSTRRTTTASSPRTSVALGPSLGDRRSDHADFVRRTMSQTEVVALDTGHAVNIGLGAAEAFDRVALEFFAGRC